MAAPYQSLVESIFRRVYGTPFDAGVPPWERGESAEPPNFDGKPSENAKCSGLVIVADGVGGFHFCGTALRYILGSTSSKLAVLDIPWGHGFGRWHADLTRVANRDAWAGAMAKAVERFHDRYPNLPVYLIGKSGGTGIVVKALERVAAGTVERAILLAPALSPQYDLAAALRGVHRDIVVFWSPLDVVILGAGTRIFGTIDRERSISAGLVGFRVPKPLQPAPKQSSATGAVASGSTGGDEYAKLRQIRWQPQMIRTGYFGGHLGPDSPAFLRMYVAPLLRPESNVGS